MKSHTSLILGLIAGLAIGAISVQGLHAKAKAPAYLIVENNISNPAAYKKEFVPVINRGIKEHGGQVIAAGKPTAFLGAAPKAHIVIQRWDSMDQLTNWLHSQQFKDALKIGRKYAKHLVFAIPGVTR